MSRFLNFYNHKIKRNFGFGAIFAIIFWSLLLFILFLLLVFLKKHTWYNALSVVAVILIAISLLATVVRLGLFSSYSFSYNSSNLRSTRKLKNTTNPKLQGQPLSSQELKDKKKQKSLIPILLGFTIGVILLIVSLPFIF
ncbi:DUF3899 domain-containing protein [Mesomycoplasma conjunctivae]|uniref:DUF3899 domain-containing protein n=1 Tax=Mesomycoplasma conjunctivae TaxID=45361 RepID=UPI0002D991F3|nr:DUF3899 domain-containing protein [Mesomycoplasma conjunctivae]